jgi:hypothetical protein
VRLSDFYVAEVRPRLTAAIVFGEGWGRRAGRHLRGPCPLHNGRSDAFAVNLETLLWRCHSQCQMGGDPIKFIQLRDGLDFRGAVEELARRVGVSPEKYRRLYDLIPPKPAAAHSPPPAPERPPRAEVKALWRVGEPINAGHDDFADYLSGRGIDPVRVDDESLARVLPVGTALPAWASHWGNGPRDYRLILPTYDERGRMVGLRSRPPFMRKDRKALPAKGQWGGTVLANNLARGLLRGDSAAVLLVRQAGLLIAEGEPDFMALATSWSDADDAAPAVFGIVSGSWSAEIAARVPAGIRVVFFAHDDRPGRGYAIEVQRTLPTVYFDLAEAPA